MVATDPIEPDGPPSETKASVPVTDKLTIATIRAYDEWQQLSTPDITPGFTTLAISGLRAAIEEKRALSVNMCEAHLPLSTFKFNWHLLDKKMSWLDTMAQAEYDYISAIALNTPLAVKALVDAGEVDRYIQEAQKLNDHHELVEEYDRTLLQRLIPDEERLGRLIASWPTDVSWGIMVLPQHAFQRSEMNAIPRAMFGYDYECPGYEPYFRSAWAAVDDAYLQSDLIYKHGNSLFTNRQFCLVYVLKHHWDCQIGPYGEKPSFLSKKVFRASIVHLVAPLTHEQIFVLAEYETNHLVVDPAKREWLETYCLPIIAAHRAHMAEHATKKRANAHLEREELKRQRQQYQKKIEQIDADLGEGGFENPPTPPNPGESPIIQNPV